MNNFDHMFWPSTHRMAPNSASLSDAYLALRASFGAAKRER
jgi:hypothetical protein